VGKLPSLSMIDEETGRAEFWVNGSHCPIDCIILEFFRKVVREITWNELSWRVIGMGVEAQIAGMLNPS